jgi:hypothetical protein
VTAAIFALALSLGSWAYQHRRGSLHEGRLQRLVQAHPTSLQVAEALLAEGAVVVESPPTEEGLRRLAGRWSARRADDVVERWRRWPEVRVFGLPDVVYFLYFDENGKLQDYVFLAR